MKLLNDDEKSSIEEISFILLEMFYFLSSFIRIPSKINLFFQNLIKYCQYIFYEKWIVYKYENLVKHNKEVKPKLLWNAACVYNTYEKYNKALNPLIKLIDIDVEHNNDKWYYRKHSLLAWCYHHTGNTKYAIEIMNNIEEKSFDKFYHYKMISMFYRESADLENAYDTIFKTIPYLTTNKHLESFFNEITFLFCAEKNNLSRRTLYCIRKVLKKKRLSYFKTKYLAYEISKIAEESGKNELFKVALIFYNKILESKKFKPNKDFYYSIAFACYGARDFKNAKKYITKGLKFKKNIKKDSDYYYLMSIILANLGKYKSSIIISKKILKLPYSSKNQMYYNLLLCYEADGQKEKVKEFLKLLDEKDLDEAQQKVFKRIKLNIIGS